MNNIPTIAETHDKIGVSRKRAARMLCIPEITYESWISGVRPASEYVRLLIAETVKNGCIHENGTYYASLETDDFLDIINGIEDKRAFYEEWHISRTTFNGWVSGRYKPPAYVMLMIKELIG